MRDSDSIPKPPRTKKHGRAIAVLLILPWLAAIVLAAEVAETLRARRVFERSESRAWHDPAVEQARFTGTFGLEAPVGRGKDVLAREHFAAQSADERDAWARERGEAVLICASNGSIVARHMGDSLPAIKGFLEQASKAGNLFAALPPMESSDARMAFTLALTQQFREYELPQPGVDSDVAQFTFMALNDESDSIAVFIRPSVWKILWRDFRPGAHQDDLYDIRINSHGFRDDETRMPKPPGLYRIVCMGGSTTAEGPTNAHTYPNLLERLLQERFGAERVEVINAGVFASRSGNEYDRAAQVLSLDPDLVLHFNAVNDITQWLPVWMEDAPLAGLRRLLSRSNLVFNHFNRWLLPGDALLRAGLREVVMNNLGMLADAVKTDGARMVFASFSHPELDGPLAAEKQAYFNRILTQMHWGRFIGIDSYVHVVRLYNEELQRLCDEKGTTYLPFAERFQHGPESYTDICHLHLHAIGDKATAMADLLVPLLEEGLEQHEESR